MHRQGLEPETENFYEHRITPTSVSASPSHTFPWEREITPGVYENLKVSRIEKLVSQYVLTTYCTGIHRIFIHENSQFDLARYMNLYVHVRYRHVEETRHVQCVKAPYPPIKGDQGCDCPHRGGSSHRRRACPLSKRLYSRLSSAVKSKAAAYPSYNLSSAVVQRIAASRSLA